MGRCVTGLITLALGLTAAGELAAQSRVVVPIIIHRPAAASPATGGRTETRVFIAGQGASGVAPGRATSFSSSLTNSQEIRVFITPRDPGGGGSSTTAPRVSESGATGTSGATGPAPRHFATSPTTRQEIRVFVHDPSSAPTTPTAPRSFHTSPTQRQEIRVFGTGAKVEIPIVIVPE